MLIYSLLFLKYTQRPLAQNTGHQWGIQPKAQVHTNQALQALGRGSCNHEPRVRSSRQEGKPETPPTPRLGLPELFSGLQRLGGVWDRTHTWKVPQEA